MMILGVGFRACPSIVGGQSGWLYLECLESTPCERGGDLCGVCLWEPDVAPIAVTGPPPEGLDLPVRDARCCCRGCRSNPE